MAKKKTQNELDRLREDYLIKRENILKSKVNGLQAKLFDKVFNRYLMALEQNNGVIVSGGRNTNMAAGLDRIYKQFQLTDNAPVVNTFINDLNGLHDLNIEYFNSIDSGLTKIKAPIVKAAVDRQLGIDTDGSIKQGGFTDKFLRDTKTLKAIKKITNQAISKGATFTDLKAQLKEYITGNPKVPYSGGLQQYYRNYAYDTYSKVDRITQQQFGDKLGLKYFIYTGGLIKTSRAFCQHYNGKIVDVESFSKLTYNDLPQYQRDGIPEQDWDPMTDLGGYGCRHRIRYVPTSFAEKNQAEYDQRAKERVAKLNA